MIKELLKKNKGLYYFVPLATENEILKEFRLYLGEYLNDSILSKFTLGFEDIFKIIADKNLIIILDEFPNMIRNNLNFLSRFQKIIDEILVNSTAKIIITGSSMSVIKEKVLDYESPLYGRRTGQLKLQPLNFRHLNEFDNLSFKESLDIFSMTDGIPYYIIDAIYHYKQFNDITKIFLQGNLLFEEAENLILSELREPANYYQILTAISNGKHKFGDIVNDTELKSNAVSQYLDNLIRLNIVAQKYPNPGKEKLRNKRYYIFDNYFTFYFNMIKPNKSSIINKNIIGNFKEKFNRYLGAIFEKAIIDILIDSNKFSYDSYSNWGHKTEETDIVAINENKKEILFCECKWQDNVDALTVFEQLQRKSKLVDWNNNKRKANFAIFARSFKTKKIDGVALYDLKDIESLQKN